MEKRFEGTCNELILPGVDGEMAVLGGHAPLLTLLDLGVTIVMEDSKETVLSTGEGFATIAENKVVCLVDYAKSADELDFPALKAELDEVQGGLNAQPGDDALRTRKRELLALLRLEGHGLR